MRGQCRHDFGTGNAAKIIVVLVVVVLVVVMAVVVIVEWAVVIIGVMVVGSPLFFDAPTPFFKAPTGLRHVLMQNPMGISMGWSIMP